MRLVIDLQGAQSASRWRGIGRYSLALAQAMARHGADHEIIIALNGIFADTIAPIKEAFAGLIPPKNIVVWNAPGPVRGSDPANADRRARAEILYETFLASLEPDVIHISSLFDGQGDDVTVSIKSTVTQIPTAVTFYDLIPLHDPDRYLKPNPTWEALYTHRLEALKRADLLLAISEFTAQDGEDLLGVDPSRIATISSACSDVFKPSKMHRDKRLALRQELGLDGPFIMTSGTVDPHKNIQTLFAAFARLPQSLQKQYKIAIIGQSGKSDLRKFHEMAKSVQMDPGQIVTTGYLSDDDLIALYSETTLMVFPSKDEGFGLPPLEAMSCGAPTIGSNAASIPEVIGLAEAQFDPDDADALSNLIGRALQDDDFRARLAENSATRAKLFSWDESAKRALAALEALHAKVKPSALPAPALDMAIDALGKTARPSKREKRMLAAALGHNHPRTGAPRKLFVDISELHRRDARTGIQRVVRSILNEWIDTPPADVTVVPVYATKESDGYRHARHYISKLTNTPVSGPDEPITYQRGDLFFGLDLDLDALAAQRFALERMRTAGVEIRFMVYDILPVQMPEHFDPNFARAFETWLRTISQFDGIIGISQATVDAYRSWRIAHNAGNNAAFRYDVAHLGADIDNSAPSTGLPSDHPEVLENMAARPSFLSVGTLEPRKGHWQILAAFSKLWADGVDVNLVLVGKDGWKMTDFVSQILRHPEYGKRLIWLKGISDEYLHKVYDASTCLIAASLGEGFGLPLIEAAQAGVPVLARDIPVFREVAGDHATYFNGKSRSDLAQAVIRWLATDAAGQAVPSRDMPWITWAQSAAQVERALFSDVSNVDPVTIETVQGFTPYRGRIVVMQLEQDSDLLLAIPALSRLRARYPYATIDGVTRSATHEIAQKTGLFDTVYSFDAVHDASDQALDHIRNHIGPCDMALDLNRHAGTRPLLIAMQAELKAGYETDIPEIDIALQVRLPHWEDTPNKATPLNRTHRSEQMLAVIDALPADINDYITWPALHETDPRSVHTRSVALFVRAQNEAREWGDDNFRALAEQLAQSSQVDRVDCYFASASEAEAAGFASDGKIHVHSALSFDDLATSVARAQICVANNAFGAHLAAYLGVHTVGIYGAEGLSEEWAPYFGKNDVISRPIDRAPTHATTRAGMHAAQLGLQIPPDQVAAHVLSVLDQQKPN